METLRCTGNNKVSEFKLFSLPWLTCLCELGWCQFGGDLHGLLRTADVRQRFWYEHWLARHPKVINQKWHGFVLLILDFTWVLTLQHRLDLKYFLQLKLWGVIPTASQCNMLTLYIQRLWNASFITMSSSSVNLMKANPHSFFSALLALARMNKIMHINNITVCTYWTQFSIST